MTDRIEATMQTGTSGCSPSIEEAIKLNKQFSSKLDDLKRRCFDCKVTAPLELSQRSSRTLINHPTQENIPDILKFNQQEEDVILKELSTRLNIQGMTMEQFLTGRIQITEEELIIILCNKLKYPNQYSTRKTARLLFEMSIFDSEDRREIDDILFALNKKISYTSYNRTLGKQLFDNKGITLRNVFYHKFIKGKPIEYHRFSQFLADEGMDAYQICEVLAYILEASPLSTFYSIELKCLLIKEDFAPNNRLTVATQKYEKKQSIMTKSSENQEITSANMGKEEEFALLDCEIEVVGMHELHHCGIYDCQH